MKLKKGMRVTCEIRGDVIEDAKIQEESGKFYICQNVRDGSDCKDKLGYEYSWRIDRGSDNDIKRNYVTNLKLKNKTLDDLQEGDIITDGFCERMVLGVCGKVYLMSCRGDFDSYATGYTSEDLKGYDFKLKEEKEEVKELTISEISEKLGYTVKVVKEKK